MPVLYGLHLCSYKELNQLLSLFFALCKLREGGGKHALCHVGSCLDCNVNIWNFHKPGATSVLLQPFSPGPSTPSPLTQLLQGTLRGCAVRATRAHPRPATPSHPRSVSPGPRGRRSAGLGPSFWRRATLCRLRSFADPRLVLSGEACLWICNGSMRMLLKD